MEARLSVNEHFCGAYESNDVIKACTEKFLDIKNI